LIDRFDGSLQKRAKGRLWPNFLKMEQMMKVFYLMIVLCLTTIGCHQVYSPPEACRYHEDGRVKPTIAFIPVYHSYPEKPLTPWGLSEEFTFKIRDRLLDNGDLYIAPIEQMVQISSQLEANKLFSSDLNFSHRFYPGHDFILIVQALEHKQILNNDPKKPLLVSPGTIHMKFRIRLIGFNQGRPKVVLQEIIAKEYSLKPLDKTIDYSKMHWDSYEFTRTPLGQAHTLVQKEIAQRVETYIKKTRI
jgi:hypothetical protein